TRYQAEQKSRRGALFAGSSRSRIQSERERFISKPWIRYPGRSSVWTAIASAMRSTSCGPVLERTSVKRAHSGLGYGGRNAPNASAPRGARDALNMAEHQ